MVINKNNDIMKSLNSKDSWKQGSRARKINASTDYDTCSEQLSPFGGLLGLIKFLDLLKFKEVIESTYIKPRQKPKLGNYLNAYFIIRKLRSLAGMFPFSIQ